jgi:S1-C subfamily serine protease
MESSHDEHGIPIFDVLGSSLAELANFQRGDLIQAVNGCPVRTQSDVFTQLDKASGTSTVAITVLRNDQMLTLNLTI